MAKLYFKYGAMGSSKTATALITKYNYEERGMRVWLMKPAADRRDGEFTLRSRIGLTAQCEAIGPDCDLRRRYAEHDKVDVIIVDECQFLTGKHRPAAGAGRPRKPARPVLRPADGFPDEAFPRQPAAV